MAKKLRSRSLSGKAVYSDRALNLLKMAAIASMVLTMLNAFLQFLKLLSLHQSGFAAFYCENRSRRQIEKYRLFSF